METVTERKSRMMRHREEIIRLLEECSKSNLNIKDFCAVNNIIPGTFHNWKKRYSRSYKKVNEPAGFASLKITSSVPGPAVALFAEVNGIRIYQPVTAAYLKELLA